MRLPPPKQSSNLPPVRIDLPTQPPQTITGNQILSDYYRTQRELSEALKKRDNKFRRSERTNVIIRYFKELEQKRNRQIQTTLQETGFTPEQIEEELLKVRQKILPYFAPLNRIEH